MYECIEDYGQFKNGSRWLLRDVYTTSVVLTDFTTSIAIPKQEFEKCFKLLR